MYDLYAVCNHQGVLGGGHYYAFALNQGQWRCYNDNHVSVMRERDVVTPSAYLLFYRRRGLEGAPLHKLYPRLHAHSRQVNVTELKKSKWNKPAGHDADLEHEAGGAGSCAVM